MTAVIEGGLAPGPGIEDPAPGPTPGITGGPGTEATPGEEGGQDQRVAAGAARVEKMDHKTKIDGQSSTYCIRDPVI